MYRNSRRQFSFIISVLILFFVCATGLVFAESDTNAFKTNSSGNPEEGKYIVSEYIGEDGNPVRITTDVPYNEWHGITGSDEDDRNNEEDLFNLVIKTLANVYGGSGKIEYSGYWEQPHYCTAEGRTSLAYCVEPDVINLTTYNASTSYEYDPIICAVLYYGYGGDGNILGDSGEAWMATWNCIRREIGESEAAKTPMTEQLWNYAVSNPLPSGSYYIKFSDPIIQDVVGCLYKAPEVGNLFFQKYDDSGNAISGGSYHVTGNGVDQYITSGQTVTGLYPGNYTVTEVTAPTGYVCKDQSTTVYVSAGNTVTATLANKKQYADIKVMKYDYETDKTTQGDAMLEGAIFEVHQGSAKGPVIGTLTTDRNGNTETLKNQPLGTYYIVETNAPQGYKLDTTPIVVDFNWKVETQRKDVLDTPVEVRDQVKKGSLYLEKYYHENGSRLERVADIGYTLTLNSDHTMVYRETTDADGKLCFTDIPYGEYTLHEVEETIPSYHAPMEDRIVNIVEDGKQLNYYIDDERVRAQITIVKKDSEDNGVISVAGAKFKIIDLNGTVNSFVEQTQSKRKISEWITDDTGTLTLDESLPSGNYVLVEIIAPDGYTKFNGTQSYEVDGLYYYGVPFMVDRTSVTKQADGSYAQTVEISNEPAKGRIQIYKTGDTLIGSHTEEMTAGETYETTTFDYGQEPLSGVTFNVYAKEDIVGKPTIDPKKYDEAIQKLPDKYDPLYDLAMVVWETKYLTDRVYYKKGDLVETIITGSDGKAETKDLFFGKYELIEVGAPEGYIIDETPISAEITYRGQEVTADLNIASLFMEDSKQNGVIKVSSKQIEKITGYYQDGEKLRVKKEVVQGGSGIFFGLYANEDIKTLTGSIVVSKDTLIEVIEVQGDGSAKTSKNIPNGKYYLKELETLEELSLNTSKYPIEYKGTGNEDVSTVMVNNGAAVLNNVVYSEFKLSKTSFSIYGAETIPGCSYRILTENGTEIYHAVTDEKGEIEIKVGTDDKGDFGLGVGIYYIEEYAAPKGILIDHTKYKIIVKKDNKDQSFICTTSQKEDAVIMGDIDIQKLGEDTTNCTVGEDGQTRYEMIPLAEVKFAVRAAEDIVLSNGTIKAYKGDIVAYTTSDNEGKASPSDYSFMNEEMSDERKDQTETVSVYHYEGREYYYDSLFDQYVCSDNLSTIERSAFEVLITNGKAIFKENRIQVMAEDLTKSTDSRILKENHAFLGKYCVEEVEVPEKYRLTEQLHEVILDCDNNETELVSAKAEIKNFCKKGDVELTKTDIATDETIANTSVRIYRDGDVIFEGKTDINGKKMIKDLPIGNYSYQEFDAPDGVLIDDSIVPFDVTDYGITKAVIEDELSVGVLEIHKTGDDTINYTVDESGQTNYVQIPLAGVRFKVIAAEDIISPSGVKKACSGDTVGYAVTDETGKAKFSYCTFMTQSESEERIGSTPRDLTITASQRYAGLYLGKYKVYEIETTEAYRFSKEVHEVSIDFAPVKYINVTENWSNYCKKGDAEITKTDIATDERLPNCGIRIYDERGIVFEGYTDREGRLVLKDLPIGKYKFQEFDAPDGTLINEDVFDFEITDYGSIKAEIKDTLALGNVSIIKRCEDRKTYQIDDTGMTQYDMIPFEGVRFKLVAAEDIVSPSGVVKAKKGDIVSYTTTDENGKATFDQCFFMTKEYSEDRHIDVKEDLTDLDSEETKTTDKKTQVCSGAYFGEYIVKEAQQVKDYRLNENEYKVVLEYIDDKTAIVEAGNILIDNEAEKGDVLIHKTDANTGEVLPNTGIRIFDEKKNIIFEGRTDDNGDLKIRSLPTGKYSYQEYDAPDGYAIDESFFDFEIKDGEVTTCGITNASIPDTGLNEKTATILIVIALILAAAIIIALRVRSKRS